MPSRDRSSCLEEPYSIPQLYVEDVESDTYLELQDSDALIVRNCLRKDRAKCLGKTVYGTSIDFIDLVNKKVVKGFAIILPPGYEEGYYIAQGSKIEPIPVEGVRVSLEVCEGVKVKKWDTLGYVLTRKRELRHIKTHVPGIVVYIYSSPAGNREENIVFVAPEEVVRYIRVRR